MVQDQSTELIGLDAKWEQLLLHKVNSFIKWDLVRFFHDNPHTADTAEHIAQHVGRDGTTIARELDELVGSRILQTKKIKDGAVYQLVSDPDVRSVIQEFMDACYNRDFRVQAIHTLIQGMEASSA